MKITAKIMTMTAIVVLFLFGLGTSTGYAQGVAQDRITFNIGSGFELRMGDYVLPAGKYILKEVDDSTPDIFALYKDTDMNSPIAAIQTTRIDYQSGEYPEKSKVMLRIDRDGLGAYLPVLTGWTVPGKDGWQIIGVVEKKKGILTLWSDWHHR